MTTIRTLPAPLVSLVWLALVPGATAAEPAPPSTPTTPSTSTPPPVAGKLKLVLQHVGGDPLFAIAGSRIVLRGIVIPYVAGQRVKVSFYREGHKVGVKRLAVLPIGNGAGQFHVGFTSGDAGTVQARAAHYATVAQAPFSARSRTVQFVHANLAPGSQGLSVHVMQSELSSLHFAVPLNGVFDEATGRALVAYRKMTNLARIPAAGTEVFRKLARGAGSFHVRYRHDGRHVEANLTRQVLAEIEPRGQVRRIYMMSSGKPSTPTVVGRFQVYLKAPGTNAKGMFDSNFFVRGYAIHGYPEVPTYAASHGCLRVPNPDAPSIFAWVQDGTPVDVYNESGGGSSTLRKNAGP